MLQLDIPQLMELLNQLIWPFFRIGAFFMAIPVIGTQLMPAKIRLLLAVLVTAIAAPLLPKIPLVDPVSAESVVLIIQQLIVGVGMAFILQVFLQLFVTAGQMIAMKMGLGFASMVDPSNGVSVTVLSQFHLMLVTLLFIAVNGHLVAIEVMIDSFQVIPVGQGLSGNALWAIASWGSWMFAGALLVSLPAITALLLVNCSLGVITRAAPQLNIFAIGFPAMLVLGLLIIWVSMGGILPHFDRFNSEALEMIRQLTMM